MYSPKIYEFQFIAYSARLALQFGSSIVHDNARSITMVNFNNYSADIKHALVIEFMCFISAKLDIYVVKICRPQAYILDSVCFENSSYVYRTCANEHQGRSAAGIQTIDALGKNMDHENKKALKCCFVVLHLVYGQR